MHRSATLAAAALIALATAAPAHATGRTAPSETAPSETAPSDPPEGLILTVSGRENTWMRGVLLQCPPLPDGPHANAVAACAALHAAGGDLNLLPGDPHPCHKKFDPVTVTAAGTWRDRPVAWRKTYTNACTLDAATGTVFRF
jgi:hypothetical protein